MKLHKLFVLSVFSMLMQSVCALELGVIVWDKDVEKVARNFIAELPIKRGGVLVPVPDDENELHIRSCEQFYALKKKYTSEEAGPWSDAGYNYFQVCVEAEWLNKATAAKQPVFSNGDYLKDLCENLDLTTMRGSFRQRMKDKTTPCTFWKKGINIDKQKHVLTVDEKSWGFGFEFIGFGDFNGDGIEDALIQYTDISHEGSYGIIGPMILYKDQKTGKISAKDVYDE